ALTATHAAGDHADDQQQGCHGDAERRQNDAESHVRVGQVEHGERERDRRHGAAEERKRTPGEEPAELPRPQRRRNPHRRSPARRSRIANRLAAMLTWTAPSVRGGRADPCSNADALSTWSTTSAQTSGSTHSSASVLLRCSISGSRYAARRTSSLAIACTNSR